jgi:hypothetical protein
MKVLRRQHPPPGGEPGSGADDELLVAPERRTRKARAAPRSVVGISMILVSVGAWLGADALASVDAAELTGGNVPVNEGAIDPRDISAHNSPTLVQNPTNAANVVVANRIDTPRFSCALHVSFDGGASFSQTPLPVPAGEPPKCYAPDAAFSSDGTLYVSFVTLIGRGNVPHAVWISSSDDGGATLSEPARAQGDLSFQVRLAAHPEIADKLYLTRLDAREVALYRFTTTGNPIRASVSDDGARTWSYPRIVTPAARERVVAGSPAVAPDGTLHVAYLDVGDDRLDYEGGHEGLGGPPHPGRWQLVMASSHDDGRTWTETAVDYIVPTERFLAFLPPFPTVAAGPDGSLYVAFHDGRAGDADVYLWRSDDGGRTFGRATRVNDTVPGDGTAQRLPKVSVAPDGRVDVVYYDRRADEDDVMTEVSLQSSYDRGATFTDHRVLSDRPFDSTIGFGSDRDMPDLGSRLGLLSTDDKAMAVWTDTRAGTSASNKQDLVRALVSFPRPRRC